MSADFSRSSRTRPATTTHAYISEWIQESVRSGNLAPPSQELCRHVAECALCKGLLIKLFADLAGIAPVEQDIDCQECLDDLPAFIDQELDDPIGAIRLYPHVWWHLWVCEECAEDYRMTRALVEAHRAGEIALPSLSGLVSRSQAILRSTMTIARDFLSQAIPPLLPALGAMRGPDLEPFVLTEGVDSEGRSIDVSMQWQSDDAWRMIVAATPPPSGFLVFTLGEWAFRERFDSQGAAVVPGVPTALLVADEGPDLVIEIELDDG